MAVQQFGARASRLTDASMLADLTTIGGIRNRVLNGTFTINQRVYVSNTALSAGTYSFDRWKAGSNGATLTFTKTVPDTVVTIGAGSLLQIVEASFMEGGTFVLSWTGTAQARVYQGSNTPGSYVNRSSLGMVVSLTAGSNTMVEFTGGTVCNVQLEAGTLATLYERRPPALDFELCQRYMQTSFPTGSGPGVASNGNNLIYDGIANNFVTLFRGFFPVLMRAVPTVVVYSTSTGAANFAYNASGNADFAANAPYVTASYLSINANNAYITNNTILSFNFTAIAEL